MRLLRGSTGFDASAVDRDAELRTFVTACTYATRITGGSVTDVEPAGVTPSFHTAYVTHGACRTAVLRHLVLPFVAFSRPRPSGTITLEFVDHPAMAAALAEASELRVLTVEQLNEPADLTDLGPSELAQIGYWRPGTAGEVLFNFWD